MFTEERRWETLAMKLVGNVATQYMGYVTVGCVISRKLALSHKKHSEALPKTNDIKLPGLHNLRVAELETLEQRYRCRPSRPKARHSCVRCVPSMHDSAKTCSRTALGHSQYI